jgi:hypothetical protein
MRGAREVRRRRARAVLLWGALVFIALQAALAAALELNLFLRDPEDGYRFGLLCQFDHGQEPFVLALGTSRTANGVCSDFSPPGKPCLFNYGISGADLPEQALRLRRLLAAGFRPQVVYLEILPAHLAQDWCRVGDHPGRLGWSDLAGLDLLDLPRGRVLLRWGWDRALPCISAQRVLLSCSVPQLLPEWARMERFWKGVSESGWRVYGRERVSEAEYAEGLQVARERYYKLLQRFRIRPVPDRAVRDMLSKCREAHIPVVLYLMPEASGFRAWYSAESQIVLPEYLDRLRREYGVRVIDARDWLPDDAFADGHHLLRGGATAFTTRFLQKAGQFEDEETHGSGG